MKKYLSCIILIALCIVCATIFYVSANVLDENTASSTTGSSQAPSDDKDSISNVSISKSGTILSEYLTPSNLRIEWAAYKAKNDGLVYVGAELYLDTPEQVTNAGKGYISVCGKKREFETSTMVGKTNLLASFADTFEMSTYKEFVFEAYLDLTSYTASGDRLDGLSAKGTVIIDESQEELKSSALLDLKHISKFPELPSGDEVTSLCMVLSYLGYNVSKTELSDLYLSKGPSHYTDIFEANAGNPEDAYNSYGCMPPVIVAAANKYIAINGGSAYARDISGQDIQSIYNEVSNGHPVIVWACEEFDTTPSVFRTLIIDGKTVYLKANTNTLVLIGYDYSLGTVTLANPSGTVFEMDMAVFETGFAQVGAYAVLIK
jgi:uncharacterized protein YvpB